jgi:hypothetical protein
MTHNPNIRFIKHDEITNDIIYFSPEKNKNSGESSLNWQSPHDKKIKYIEVVDNSKNWVGAFECGDGNYNSDTEILGNFIGVVISGQGYWVNYHYPDKFFCIKSHPICSMLISKERNEAYFISFTEITSFGENGLNWVSERLSYDGIKNVSVESGFIQGLAWDASSGNDVIFNLSITDGKHSGGAFFG